MIFEAARLILSVTLALMTASMVGEPENAQPTTGSDVIVIFLVADENGRRMADVTALLVTKDGEKVVGHTDVGGAVGIPLDQLASANTFAVLLCKEGFYCGAIRTSEPRFLEYREHYIKLTLVELL